MVPSMYLGLIGGMAAAMSAQSYIYGTQHLTTKMCSVGACLCRNCQRALFNDIENHNSLLNVSGILQCESEV